MRTKWALAVERNSSDAVTKDRRGAIVDLWGAEGLWDTGRCQGWTVADISDVSCLGSLSLRKQLRRDSNQGK